MPFKTKKYLTADSTAIKAIAFDTPKKNPSIDKKADE